jgi:hypothetical protein
MFLICRASFPDVAPNKRKCRLPLCEGSLAAMTRAITARPVSAKLPRLFVAMFCRIPVMRAALRVHPEVPQLEGEHHLTNACDHVVWQPLPCGSEGSYAAEDMHACMHATTRSICNRACSSIPVMFVLSACHSSLGQGHKQQ